MVIEEFIPVYCSIIQYSHYSVKIKITKSGNEMWIPKHKMKTDPTETSFEMFHNPRILMNKDFYNNIKDLLGDI